MRYPACMSDLKKARRRIEIETVYELMERLDYYQLLGLDRKAHQSAVEPAFREASRNYHPDRCARLGDKSLTVQSLSPIVCSLRPLFPDHVGSLSARKEFSVSEKAGDQVVAGGYHTPGHR